jgi:hypothetical protein
MFNSNIFRQNGMESHSEMIESLAEKALDYGKISFKLAKLKALSKTSEVISSSVSNSAVLYFAMSFLLFLNLGIAIWLGEFLGRIFIGFFIIAAFYGLVAIFFYLFLHKWLKRLANDYFIEQVLK